MLLLPCPTRCCCAHSPILLLLFHSSSSGLGGTSRSYWSCVFRRSCVSCEMEREDATMDALVNDVLTTNHITLLPSHSSRLLYSLSVTNVPPGMIPVHYQQVGSVN